MPEDWEIPQGVFDQLKYSRFDPGHDKDFPVSVTFVNNTDFKFERSDFPPASGDIKESVKVLDKWASTTFRMSWSYLQKHSGDWISVAYFRPYWEGKIAIKIRFRPSENSIDVSAALEDNWTAHDRSGAKGYRNGFYRMGSTRFLVVFRKLPFPSQEADSGAPSSHTAAGTPCAVGWERDAYVFYEGSDNKLQWSGHRLYDPSWMDQTVVPRTRLRSTPGAVVFKGKIYVFHQGHVDFSLFYNAFNPRSKEWDGDKLVKNVALVGAPSAAFLDGKIHIVHLSGANDNTLRHITFDGDQWSADVSIPNVRCMDSPSLVVYKWKLYCFYRGQEPEGGLYVVEYDGKNWGNHKMSHDLRMSSSPSAVLGRGEIYIFHRGPGKSQTLWCQTFDGESFTWQGDIWQVDAAGSPAAAVAEGGRVHCFHWGGSSDPENGRPNPMAQLYCVVVN